MSATLDRQEWTVFVDKDGHACGPETAVWGEHVVVEDGKVVESTILRPAKNGEAEK